VTSSLVLLCVAAAAMVASVTSVVTGAALALARRMLDRMTPRAQARLLLCAALLPAFATIAIMIAALAPSFGWVTDHCDVAIDLHGHPHICVHHRAIAPPLPLTIIAALFAVRAGFHIARLIGLGFVTVGTKRRLRRSATGEFSGARVLPVGEPQAFIVGVFAPVLYVTRGLLAPENRMHADSVLAHERAHLHRGDPLRRVVVMLSLIFHVPGVARWIERRLACAQEMAADLEAADAVGSRARVASALVHLARSHSQRGRLVFGFGGSDVELRVRALMDSAPRSAGPGPRFLAALACVLLLSIAGAADAVHHGVEHALGLLTG
jgi:Zn-dependent protease with chaperone function